MAETKKENRITLRGFASMTEEQKRVIASKGGKAVSSNKAHMSAIGQKGGETSGANRRKRAMDRKSEPIVAPV